MLFAAESEVSAGPLGLLVVVLIAIATVLLIRNMSARLKRMPRSFDDPPSRSTGTDGDGDGEQPPPQA
jgi:hypothetical protein